MEGEINMLFARYGIVEVKEYVERECRRIYESLHNIYEVKRKYERKVKIDEEQEKVKEEENPAKQNPAKPIRKVKKAEVEVENEEETEPNSANTDTNTGNILRIIKKINKTEPVAEPIAEPVQEVVEKTEYNDEKDSHRIAVAEKYKELVEKGIEPASLLTKENLDTWLKSGKTYLKIAKETGIHESEISSKAKEFGLSSMASKYKFYKKGKTLQK